MNSDLFLQKLKETPTTISFAEAIATIEKSYIFF